MRRSRVEVENAIRKAAAQVADAVREPSATSRPIRNSTRNVGDVGAHVAMGQGLFAELIEGATSPFENIDDFPGLNAKFLGEFTERDGSKLAGMIVESTRAFLDVSQKYTDDHVVNFHFRGKLAMTDFMSYALYHVLAHSYEIAMATGKPNPIDRSTACLTMPFFKAVAPMVVDPGPARGLQACIEIRVRKCEKFAFEFRDGNVAVLQPPPRKVDCYLSADPVDLFLTATGLVSHWRGISKGGLFSWGKRPWLALRLTKLLRAP